MWGCLGFLLFIAAGWCVLATISYIVSGEAHWALLTIPGGVVCFLLSIWFINLHRESKILDVLRDLKKDDD